MKNKKRSKKLQSIIFSLLIVLLFTISFLLISCSKEKESQYNESNNISENKGDNSNLVLKWDEYDKIVNIDSSNDKFFMLFFYTDWCPYCKKMENETFTNRQVIEILNKNFISIKINSESKQSLSKTKKEITGISLSRTYQITGLPTVVFLDKKGSPLTAVPGFLPSDLFTDILNYLHTESYKTMDFETYKAKNKK